MKKSWFVSLLVGSALANVAYGAPNLSVSIKGIEEGKPISTQYAYCMPDGKGKTADATNISPEISWSGAPADTKSYALIVVDKDVPADFSAANKDGQVIADNAPRRDFYHWVLIDIPPSITKIPEGADNKEPAHTPKPTGKTPYGINGQNDFGNGSSGGYGGPCPPWNDERLHHYHFMIYALDVPSLGLAEPVTGRDAETAIAKHTLAKGEVTGTYTNNLKMLGK